MNIIINIINNHLTNNIIEKTNKVTSIIYAPSSASQLSSESWEKMMPWIAALIVGLMTVGANLLIGYYSRKSNKNILIEQLTHNKELALEQIKNSQNNAQKDFDKTVLSGNRQILLNSFRDIMSLILTKISITFLKQQIDTPDYEELKLLITKAELFLNPVDDKEILQSLNSLDKLYFDIISSGKDFTLLEIEIESLKSKTFTKIQRDWDRIITAT